MSIHTIFAKKLEYTPVPSGVSRLGTGGVLNLLLPAIHQNGFIYLQHQQETKQWHVYTPLLDVLAWHSSELKALAVDERAAYMKRLQATHREHHEWSKTSLVLSFNKTGTVTYIALHGDRIRDMPVLFDSIKQVCLDHD